MRLFSGKSIKQNQFPKTKSSVHLSRVELLKTIVTEMDLVISHPAIVDKGIRNIYSGLNSHHIVGPRSCDSGEKLFKQDFNHVHAMEKFRRSQVEYIPRFKTCLPRAPAYTAVSSSKVRKIVQRLYSSKRPETCTAVTVQNQNKESETSLTSKPTTKKEPKCRAHSAHPRSLIIFPHTHSRKKESKHFSSAKTASYMSDEKTVRSESPTSCKSEMTLDLSKLKRRKKPRPATSAKSEGYPGVLSSISNCYSEKDQSHYRPSRQSLFQMIQDLYLDEDETKLSGYTVYTQ